MRGCPSPRCASQRIRPLLTREVAYGDGAEAGVFSCRLLCCESCSLAFIDPVPPPRVLAALYGEHYAYHRPSEWRPTTQARLKQTIASLRYRGLLASSLASGVAEWLACLVERALGRDISFSLAVPLALPPSSALLDYGCGSGDFLLALRARGFRDLHGIDTERDQEALQWLAAQGIDVHPPDALRLLAAERFDCVRLEHVFEHLPEPLATLRAIQRLLRQNGFLVMTLPSIHPWEPLETLAASAHLDHLQIPIHLFHHSRQSLRDFLEAAGFEVLGQRLLRPHGYLSVIARPTA